MYVKMMKAGDEELEGCQFKLQLWSKSEKVG